MFQNIMQIMKSYLLFNDFKWRRMKLFCSKNFISFLREITPKINGGFYCLNCLHSF